MDIPFAIRSVQAVSSADTVSTLSSIEQGSSLVPDANSLYATPGVVLTLGTVPPVPLTYNAAGVFESNLASHGTLGGDVVTTATGATPSPVAGTMSSVTEAFDTASVASTLSGTQTANAAATTAVTATIIPAEDFAVRAQNAIASNPAYANIATALYLNTAIFRSQHESDVVLPNITRGIQPVAPVPTVYRI